MFIDTIKAKLTRHASVSTPIPVLRALLNQEWVLSENIANQILRHAPATRLKALDHPKVDCRKLLCYEDVTQKKIETLAPGNWETIRLPKIYGISEGGSASFWSREIGLYFFENALQHPQSDFIRFGDSAYWDKTSRFQLRKTIPLDRDLLAIDQENGQCFLEEPTKFRDFNDVFSLCGVHSGQWGHFLPTFLPKLQSVGLLPQDRRVAIAVPGHLDEHMLAMINLAVEPFSNLEICKVDKDTYIRGDRFYFCSSPAYLIDHAESLHIADFLISSWASQGMKKYADLATARIADRADGPNKVFLARSGARSIDNQGEIEEYFLRMGYNKVYPHKLRFEEKVQLFNGSSHIVGPGSSGFANTIFCKPATKIIMFSGYSRTLDCYFPTIAHDPFQLDLMIVAGVDDSNDGIHANYKISMGEIVKCAEALGFI